MYRIIIDTNIDAINVETALALLTEQRRSQVLSLSNAEQRRQRVAAYLCLLRGFKAFTGIEATGGLAFAYGEHGKPTLRDYPDVHFSMSHTRGAVAVVLSDNPVGIDIERADRRISPTLVRHCMNEDECRRIESAANPQAEFLRLWTMKEATAKRTGYGIAGGIKNILAGNDASQYIVQEQDGYICSVSL